MLKSVGIIIVVLFAILVEAPLAQAQTRIALVIGNSAYKTTPLLNPVNDAVLMAKTLKQTGFSVTTVFDADQKTMKRALIDFGRELRKSNAVGLFYYAGHGVQVGGENYLIPLGFNIQDETELEIEAIKLNSFLGTMQRSPDAINIVILDACRNNPFLRSFNSIKRGLARVTAPRGTYIAYATSPGQVSYDGNSGNSPYTLALARAIATPDLTIEQVFKKTRRGVMKTTNARQIPWEDSSIIGDFYFKQRLTLNKEQKLQLPAFRFGSMTNEMMSWSFKMSNLSPSLLKNYMQNYPKETFSTTKVDRAKKRRAKKPVPTDLARDLSPNYKNRTSLTRRLQKELARVGCSPGKIDGKWGRDGISALNKFNHFANKNLEVSVVSQNAYHAVKSSTTRVCPRSCSAQSELKGGICVQRTSNPEPKTADMSQSIGFCGIFKGSRFCQ